MYKKKLNKSLLPLGTYPKFFQKRYIAKERSKKCYSWCHNKWNEIIDKMIYLFKESNEDYCSKQNPYNIETEKEQYYQTYDELYYYRKDCRKKAFELFNKHFENLWS